MTNTDKISTLEKLASALEARVDNLGKEVEGLVQRSREVERLAHDVDKGLTLLADKVERLEKRLDETRSRRWELWKILLAAIVGSLLTLAVGIATRLLDRQAGIEPAGRATAPSDRK